MFYYSEFIVAPILASILFLTSGLALPAFVTLFVAGALLWTLAEYGVHRYVHVSHVLAPSHRRHHAVPDEVIEQSFWQIWVGFTVVYCVAGDAVLAGVLTAYTWYLFVHECAHHRRGWIPSTLLKHHDGHHRYATRNFGVSTTLWDRVFGTVLR
ncbi:sterol desaturase family protein [Bradyrhizobium sp. Ec3.3]|uniref:sterol desaturase family protein n=1 Tax=Bradyrhizobium sp. Ec3.3 TaxID=189753 RepID=UPI0004165C72|nr:sterol desaturase family protein [Bradyrhizobium sp. Ec3.3]